MTEFKLAQICFVLDCTGSMGPWIKAARSKILDTLHDICQAYPEFVVEVAFLGYRDFKDTEQFIRMNFTTDYERIKNILMNIEPTGGDDDAEDIAGAYGWVNSLRWNADIQTVFHITDAPNHGREYHTKDITDNFPEGNLALDLRSEVEELAVDHTDITVFRLNSSTDITYSIMENAYKRIRKNGFKIIDFVKSDSTPEMSFYNEVSRQMMTSMKSV